MRCIWCHNPETYIKGEQIRFFAAKCIGCGYCYAACPTGALTLENGVRLYDEEKCIKCFKCVRECFPGALKISGEDISVGEALKSVMQDKPYYDNSGGGVTITGGEPFMQKEFLNDLVDALKDNDIHVGIETNMSYPWEIMRPVLEKVDLVMLDIKLMDNEKHIKYTGVANTSVLANIAKLDKLGIPFIVRTPLIHGINSSKDNIAATARFLLAFGNLAYYELLPYNPLAEAKFEQLGKRYELPDVKRMSKKELSDIKASVTNSVGDIDLIVREG